jgi:two-component system OmpR family sensor kinase
VVAAGKRREVAQTWVNPERDEVVDDAIRAALGSEGWQSAAGPPVRSARRGGRSRTSLLPSLLRRPGTAGRLAMFHALVLAVVLGVVVTALVHQFSASYEAVAARGLVGEMQSFAGQRITGSEPLLGAAETYFRNHELPAGTAAAVGDLTGHYVAAGDWASSFAASSRLRAYLASPPATSVATPAQIAGREVELLAAPIVLRGKVVGSFVAATDLAPFRSDRARMLALSLAEGGVALLAGVLSTFLLLRRLLRTVGRITTTAAEIGAGEVDHRLGDQGTDDEVGQLARTFDGMLDRVEGAMTAQRRLLSDVSHQLRTPLTVARGHLEVLQRTGTGDPAAVNETVEVVVDELDHMRALVERLLLLGRVMEPDFVAPEPIDLRSFLADIDAAARVLADRDFRLPAIPDVVLYTDLSKLRGAVLNLVDNAVRATEPGDVVQLSAEIAAGGALVIAVEDSGPGIPQGLRSALLGRFERGASPDRRADGGQGLGLAIVKAVAEAHGGSVRIEGSSFGGCRVAIELPAGLVAPGGGGDGTAAAGRRL